MAVSKKETKQGRPSKLEELKELGHTIEDVRNVILNAAEEGYFWHEMPLALKEHLGWEVSERWMYKIDNQELKDTKVIAFGLITRYYTKRLIEGRFAPAPWVFIMKNVAKWTDSRELKVDGKLNSDKKDATADQESLDKFQNILLESKNDKRRA